MADLTPELAKQLVDTAKQHLILGQNLLNIAQALSKQSGVSVSLSAIEGKVGSFVPKTYFTHHQWVTPPEPIGAQQQKFDQFKGNQTMLIFYGEEDMQFEVNKKIEPNTPVIPRYIMGNFEMEVEYVTYKLSPKYAKAGPREPDPKLYLFGFGEV